MLNTIHCPLITIALRFSQDASVRLFRRVRDYFYLELFLNYFFVFKCQMHFSVLDVFEGWFSKGELLNGFETNLSCTNSFISLHYISGLQSCCKNGRCVVVAMVCFWEEYEIIANNCFYFLI